MQDDTKAADAHHYLDHSGHETTKEEFVRELREGWRAGMVYLGGSYAPLRVAVMTASHRRYYGLDEGAVLEIFEDWMRNQGRAEEIGEDEDYEKALEEAQAAEARGEKNAEWPTPEYEVWIEEIPESAAKIHDTRQPAYWEFEMARDLDIEPDYAPPEEMKNAVDVAMTRLIEVQLPRMLLDEDQVVRHGFARGAKLDEPPYWWAFDDDRRLEALFDLERMSAYAKAGEMSAHEYALELLLEFFFDVYFFAQAPKAESISETWPDEVDKSKARFVRAWTEIEILRAVDVAGEEIQRLALLPLVHKRKRWMPEK